MIDSMQETYPLWCKSEEDKKRWNIVRQVAINLYGLTMPKDEDICNNLATVFFGMDDIPTGTLDPVEEDPLIFSIGDNPDALLLEVPFTESLHPRGPHGKFAAKGILDHAHVQLQTTENAGGSNGAKWAHPVGTPDDRWIIKHYGGNEDRVATELLSNAIYREMGHSVPEAGKVNHNGKTALAYPALAGKPKSIASPSKEIGKGFMTDALLANWDVIGLTDDNILWQPDGSPARVDQGGTLQYRAMGGKKDFGHTPVEAWVMPQKEQTKRGMSFTHEDKIKQAHEIAQKLTPGKIDELVDAAPFQDEKQRKEVREALKARVEWMRQFADGIIKEKEDAKKSEDLPTPAPGTSFQPGDHIHHPNALSSHGYIGGKVVAAANKDGHVTLHSDHDQKHYLINPKGWEHSKE